MCWGKGSGRPRSQSSASAETLDNIEKSRAARLVRSRDRALSRRTRTLLKKDKERYGRSLADDVEGHLNVNDLKPAYRAMKKLRCKSRMGRWLIGLSTLSSCSRLTASNHWATGDGC